MKRKINKLYDKVKLIVESYALGEEAYSSKVDELIDELVQVKNNLKKGNNRKFFRKEASRIQNAIQTLRYLKRRSEREIMKKNDKILISESELINILQKKHILEATRVDTTFMGGIQNLINAKNIFYGLYKDVTSSMNDSGTSTAVMKIIERDIQNVHSNRINTYTNAPVALNGRPSPAVSTIISSNVKPFPNYIFGGLLNLCRGIIATYDGGSSNPSAGKFAGEPEYVGEKTRIPLNIATINRIKSGAVVVPINKMTKSLNKLILSISDIPEESTYSDSKYTARQIANDIVEIFNIPGNQVAINTEDIQHAIETNIYEKQYNALSISDTKISLAEGSMQNLAATITIDLIDYIIDGLVVSESTLRTILNETSAHVESGTSGAQSLTNRDIIETITPISTLVSSLRTQVKGRIRN